MEPLTSVSQVRALSPEEADRGLPVRLRGFITYCDPAWYQTYFHDGQHGIYIVVRNDAPLYGKLDSGDEVEVEGITGRGDFLPVVKGSGEKSATVRRVGHSNLWNPAVMGVTDFSAPEQACEWVRLRGLVSSVVRGVDRLTLDLDVDGRRFKAYLPAPFGPADVPREVVGTPVQVNGVVGTRFNNQRQMTGRSLYIPSPAAIVRETATPEVNPFDLPLRSTDAPLRIGAGGLGERIRVRGVVTAILAERDLFLRGEGGGLRVQPVRAPQARIGDVLEAVGLPEVSPFKPDLRAAVTRVVRHVAEPAPHPIVAREALDGRYHDDLVSVEGTLTAHELDNGALRLFLASGGTHFEVQLPAAGFTPPPPKSRMRITGICLVVIGPEFWGHHVGRTFIVQSRGPADLTVLSMPPWWTTRAVLWVLAGVGALAALAAVWAFLLRRRVSAQTAVIRAQLQRETIHEERLRIARDWHDTMEQQLMGVNLLLADASAELSPGDTSAAATQSLKLARRILGYCREESRASIRDLRSLTLEARGLPGALEEFLRPLVQAAGAEFSLTVTGAPGRLGGRQEQHLLRLAQEAVANAARHAQARKIEVRLTHLPREVRLEVRDDGDGFDCANVLGTSEGHFGLQGMAERAEKIGGVFRIESAPGAGTGIVVTVPAEHAPRLSESLPS